MACTTAPFTLSPPFGGHPALRQRSQMEEAIPVCGAPSWGLGGKRWSGLLLALGLGYVKQKKTKSKNRKKRVTQWGSLHLALPSQGSAASAEGALSALHQEGSTPNTHYAGSAEHRRE